MTPVRHAPEEVLGIVNLRGKIVTILDLGLRLGFSQAVAGSDSRIFIIEDRSEFIGLLVDRVDEVVEVESDHWQAPPANVNWGQAPFLQGRVPRPRPGDHAARPGPDPDGRGAVKRPRGEDQAMSMRVLVVDDTVVFRRIVSDALAGLPGVEVVGTASNGRLAMARMAALQPDLVTLDIEMPEMNGIEVLEAMTAAGLKAGVIMLSSLTVRGGEMTVRALELGAFDFLTKPEGGNAEANLSHSARPSAADDPGLRTAPRNPRDPARRRFARRARWTPPAAQLSPGADPPRPARPVRRTGPPLVLIGVSTGGPGALAKLVPALPGDLGAPVFIVQHMPALFTQPLAASLDQKSAIRVKEARGWRDARSPTAPTWRPAAGR